MTQKKSNTTADPTRIVACPQCRKPTPWSKSNRFRPFCSERCRLIDFGDWAAERHRIAGSDVYDDLLSDELEEPT